MYVVVAVLFNAGDQVPLIPLVEVVGNADKEAPEQIAATEAKFGVTFGLTVIVKNIEGPEHAPSFAVTAIVATCCVATLAAVNDEILPVPLAPKPIEGFVFVHVKVTPADGLVKLIADIVAFEQAEIFPTELTIGVGQFDETQLDVAGCAQRLPTGVIVILTF